MIRADAVSRSAYCQVTAHRRANNHLPGLNVLFDQSTRRQIFYSHRTARNEIVIQLYDRANCVPCETACKARSLQHS